jgi:aspartyl-tRNA(Asn)/glutamyl-tRNA(Gln) amidotransferase subunit A
MAAAERDPTSRTLGAGQAACPIPDLSDVCNVIARCERRRTRARPKREEIQLVVRARSSWASASAHTIPGPRLRARLSRAFWRVRGDRRPRGPVIPEPAPPLAHATEGGASEIAERQGRFSRLTRPFNGLGLPALTVPCGFSRQGLPLAFQIVGRPFDEATVLRAGHAYEQAAGWHRRRPALD